MSMSISSSVDFNKLKEEEDPQQQLKMLMPKAEPLAKKPVFEDSVIIQNSSILEEIDKSLDIRNQMILSHPLFSIFKEWKVVTKNLKKDRVLFHNIKAFIVRRLSKKGFKSLKIYHLQSQIEHYLSCKVKSKRAVRIFRNWHQLSTHLRQQRLDQHQIEKQQRLQQQ